MMLRICVQRTVAHVYMRVNNDWRAMYTMRGNSVRSLLRSLQRCGIIIHERDCAEVELERVLQCVHTYTARRLRCIARALLYIYSQ